MLVIIATVTLQSFGKIRLDISCESSARQQIHMKYHALFVLKDESKKIVSSAAIFV